MKSCKTVVFMFLDKQKENGRNKENAAGYCLCSSLYKQIFSFFLQYSSIDVCGEEMREALGIDIFLRVLQIFLK